MNIPMHRFKFTKLTKEQIGKELARTDAGPECASEFSGILAGKSVKIITRDGPVLEYTFKDSRRLILSEDGGRKINAGYGALDLKQMVFFSHMVPKTRRGLNVFIDLDTNLVTVFEVWFSGGMKIPSYRGEIEIDDREVQRQVYFGYVDVKGQEPPEELHHLTNRIQGKGMYWKQDTGIETLEFYGSVISSEFVELTRYADDLAYTSPSDYILVNDNMFIYDRTECEFAGIMTMYAVDLFTEKQVGMRLGFNAKDQLEYYMFRGRGKVVGHITPLQPFDEHGKTLNIGMGPAAKGPPPKGQRTAYRPVRTFEPMTVEEVHRAAEKNTVIFEDNPDTPQAQAGMMAGNIPPYSDILSRKEFTLRYDNGMAWDYRVTGKYNLQWRKEGEPGWHNEIYRAFESDHDLVFFAHMHSGTMPLVSVKIVLDLTNGLTTCIYSNIGTEYYGNEISYKALFGTSEMEGISAPGYLRHKFTDELTGRGFTRTYSDNMTSMHLYTTPYSSSWTIYTADQTLGMQWCAPAIYVKLREGVYLYDLVEEACNGSETCIIENDKNLHVSGFGYHGGETGVTLGVIGAIGRDLGRFNVTEYFGPNARRKGV